MPAAIREQADQTNYVKPSGDTDVMTGASSTPDTQRSEGTMLGYVNPPGSPGSTDTVNIPDKSKLNDYENQQPGGRAGTLAHETTHVLEDNLAPSVQAKIPAGNPDAPYDISNIDTLRAQGKTFTDLPREQAATIVQKYIESGGKDTRLKPWIQDIAKAPLSTIKPTTTGGADDKINTEARAPRGGQAMLEAISSKDVHNPPPAKVDTSKTMAVQNPKGLAEPGNLDITNRPTVKNADGSHSSEYSTSFNVDGKEVLVPTIVNGKFLTPDGKKPPEGSPAEKQMFKQALQHYQQTGEHLGKFNDVKSANAYAEQLHNRGNKPSTKTNPSVYNGAAKAMSGGKNAKAR